MLLRFDWLSRSVVAALQQSAQNYVKHGDEEEVEHRGEQHTAHNGGSHGTPPQCACAGGETVDDAIKTMTGKLGEKISLKRLVYLDAADGMVEAPKVNSQALFLARAILKKNFK